jgi:hypothetical protein
LSSCGTALLAAHLSLLLAFSFVLPLRYSIRLQLPYISHDSTFDIDPGKTYVALDHCQHSTSLRMSGDAARLQVSGRVRLGPIHRSFLSSHRWPTTKERMRRDDTCRRYFNHLAPSLRTQGHQRVYAELDIQQVTALLDHFQHSNPMYLLCDLAKALKRPAGQAETGTMEC